MRWRSRTINCFLFVLFVFLSCVSAWPATTPEAALVSIRIVPQNVKIGGGENPSQHLIVLAQYADGIERDVTSRAAFSLSDPAKGGIDSTGKHKINMPPQTVVIRRTRRGQWKQERRDDSS